MSQESRVREPKVNESKASTDVKKSGMKNVKKNGQYLGTLLG